ncbi:MAG: HAMP domain-containing protein [Nitrospirae bacterium]|nr:HAMP domain-containing protein [Nitrospirota bacterium]
MKFMRHVTTVAGLLLIVAAITAVELYYIHLPSVDITTRFMLISLLTINVIALLTLIFFVGKNLFKLYMEKRYNVLGHKFRTKLMTIFVILTLIPSSFLFITASGLATNYINRIFSPQIKEHFKKSIELARAFYDFGRQRVLATAQHVADGDLSVPRGMTMHKLAVLPDDATDIIKYAFQGQDGTEIVTTNNGDIIRAVVPDRSRGAKGVIVVEMLLPKNLSGTSEKLKELYEDYLKIQSFKNPLRLNYILILGFFTLLIVFAGLWVSLKISGGITTPIQSLAMATEQVASGNLDVQVTVKSEDEIGLLITSFNQMVKQLKDSKDSLEKAYIESDKRRLYLENILDNINSGVIFLDNKGTILTINRAACSILNVQQDALIGRDYLSFTDSLNSTDIAHMVKEMEGRVIREIKREVKVSINGRIAILRIYVSGIRESFTSKAMGMLVVFHDLTDVIKAQKVTAWQEVARRLAHEIKNPLTPIKLSTERLIKKWQQKDEDFDAVFEKSTKTIISEVESLRKLVDIFSRYGKMPEVNKTPNDLPELLDSVVSLYKGFKDIEITTFFSSGLPPVELDAEQFKRVIVNVMDNAIKAMDSKGTITVSLNASGNSKVIINIADTGPGIKDADKERLFLPYFTGRKGGTGLGLAIANKIVSDHGGRILVRDNTPHGSIFTIELPVA